MVGPSGRVLNQAITDAGLKRTDVYVTNTTKCRPPKNRDPLSSEQQACFQYLAEEIASVKPKVIVAIGVPALKLLSGKQGIQENRGHLIKPSPKVMLNGAKLVTTWHPSYILRKGGYRTPDKKHYDDLVTDIGLARRVAAVEQSTAELPLNNRKLLLPGYTLDELRTALQHVPARHVVVDVEWTALEDRDITWPWSSPDATIFSIAVSCWDEDGEDVNSIALSWPLPRGGLALLERYLRRRKVTNHNLQSDMIWLTWYGLTINPDHDTMFLANVMDEEQKLGLQVLAMLYAGISAQWKLDQHSASAPRTTAEWYQLLGYNTDDTWATLLLIKALLKRLQEREEPQASGLYGIYKDLMIRALPSYVEMAQTGLPMSKRRLRDLREKVQLKQEEDIAEFASKLKTSKEQAYYVATNYEQTTRYINAAYHLELTSSAAGVLDEISNEYPNVKLIKKIRHGDKLKGTYIDPWLKIYGEQGDNYLRSVYGQVLRSGRTNATTGYIGGTSQVIDREIKDVVVAPEGWVLIAADMSQVELRIIAWLANERRMREEYNTGGRSADLHRSAAGYFAHAFIDGVPVMDYWPKRREYFKLVTDQERQDGKSANFALAYGVEAKRFKAYMKSKFDKDLTLQQAEAIRTAFFTLWADLVEWHKLGEEQYKRGWVCTPMQRYRFHLKDGRVAINSPVQGMGSDMVQLAQAVIWENLRKWDAPARIARMAGESHDCILVLSKEDAATQISEEIIRPAMEHPPLDIFGVTDVPVPFYADIKIGRSWGK